MNRPLFLAALLAAICATSVGSAVTLYYDLGDRDRQTAGNYNNLFQEQTSIADSIDSTGATTGISIDISDFNPGANQSGTTAPSGDAAAFDVETTRDNVFGHTAVFSGTSPRPNGVVVLQGLDGSGATAYDFTFMASRLGVGDNRETTYTTTTGAAGSTVISAALDAANNASLVATLTGVVPTAAGTLQIDVTPGPNNTNGSGFYYLGGIQIDSVPVPEPATLGLGALALSACSLVRRRS